MLEHNIQTLALAACSFCLQNHGNTHTHTYKRHKGEQGENEMWPLAINRQSPVFSIVHSVFTVFTVCTVWTRAVRVHSVCTDRVRVFTVCATRCHAAAPAGLCADSAQSAKVSLAALSY